MSHIDQIVNDLIIADSELSLHTVRIEHESSEITNTINKAQSTFNNQQPGVALINSMYKTLQQIVKADSALSLARQEIKNYITSCKK